MDEETLIREIWKRGKYRNKGRPCPDKEILASFTENLFGPEQMEEVMGHIALHRICREKAILLYRIQERECSEPILNPPEYLIRRAIDLVKRPTIADIVLRITQKVMQVLKNPAKLDITFIPVPAMRGKKLPRPNYLTIRKEVENYRLSVEVEKTLTGKIELRAHLSSLDKLDTQEAGKSRKASWGGKRGNLLTFFVLGRIIPINRTPAERIAITFLIFIEGIRMRILLICLCLALALLLGSSPVAGADLTVCSTGCDKSNLIDSSQTWRAATYRVQEQIQVLPGATLTLEPGVTLRFTAPETGLRVEGTLIARGTGDEEGQRITFTSGQATPAPGDWGAILFTGTAVGARFDGAGNYASGSLFEHCMVEYAGGGGALGAIWAQSPRAPYVHLSTIQNNDTSGVRLEGPPDAGGHPQGMQEARDSQGEKTFGPRWSFQTGSSPFLLNPIGNKTINEGQALSFTLSGNSPDGAPLTFSASNLPPGGPLRPRRPPLLLDPHPRPGGHLRRRALRGHQRDLHRLGGDCHHCGGCALI